jgi:aminoglycoside phosphotransferase (APT) family kinase protein
VQPAEIARAQAAAISIASALGLTTDDAVALHNSNKLTLRLLPCDVLARVAPAAEQVALFEVELAQRLAEAGCPVAAPEPRVAPDAYERDGFVVTLWTHYPPTAREIPPADYAAALARLHAGMRAVEFTTPHCTDRVDSALRLLASRELTPALADGDRELLADTLHRLRRVVAAHSEEQLIHGEPHPGNLLVTTDGPVFIDLETCCRGPREFDLAYAPDEVADHYPDVDRALLHQCRILMLAMITTWRWDRDDQFPDGLRRGAEWLGQLRVALDHATAKSDGTDPGASASVRG